MARPSTRLVIRQGTADIFHNKCWAEFMEAFYKVLKKKAREGENPHSDPVLHEQRYIGRRCNWCRKRIK